MSEITSSEDKVIYAALDHGEGSGSDKEDQAMAASTSSKADVIDPNIDIKDKTMQSSDVSHANIVNIPKTDRNEDPNIDIKDKTMQSSGVSHANIVKIPKIDRNKDHTMVVATIVPPRVIAPEIYQGEDLATVASTSGTPRIIVSEIHEEELATLSLPFIVDDEQQRLLNFVVDKTATPMTLFKEWDKRGEIPYNPDNVIVEKLEEFHLERILEDHELILKVFKSWEDDLTKKLIIQKDEERFKYLMDAKYFPFNEAVPVHEDGTYMRNEEKEHAQFMKYTLVKTDKAPIYFGELLEKYPPSLDWQPAHVVIKEGKLYGTVVVPEDPVDTTDMTPLLDLRYYDIYVVMDGEEIDAKSKFSFCLKCNLPAETGLIKLHYFACENLFARQRWITALRINKYGSDALRKNFKETKALKTDHWQSSILNLGPSADRELEKLVNQDHKDIRDMVGLRVNAARNGEIIGGGILWKLTTDIHYALPWFHPNFTREQAEGLLRKRMKEDGLFLIREEIVDDSRVYVLDYIGNKSLLHETILMEDYSKFVKHYSLVKRLYRKAYRFEGGQFLFYDLVQLVEFHKLNQGILETKLCRYVGPKETELFANIRNPYVEPNVGEQPLLP